MKLDILRLCKLVCIENEGRSQNICLTTIEAKCGWKARFKYYNEKINGNKDASHTNLSMSRGVCESD